MQSIRLRAIAALSLCLIVQLLPGRRAWAADADGAETEEQIRKKELEEQARLQEGQGNRFQRAMKGKIVLSPECVASAKQDGADEKDLGTFVYEKGTCFVLRVEPGTFQEILQYDGKSVMVLGRLEVNGKYFKISSILASQGPSPGRRKLGGQ